MSERDLLALIERAELAGWETLTLSDRGLTTLPAEIGRLTNLVALDLSGNRLRELPQEIGRLTNLQALDLGPARAQGSANLGSGINGNRLTALPDAFAKLTKLKLLVLKGNCLRSLPDSIGRFSDLQLLDVSNNRLTTLPGSVTQLKHLVTLNAANNAIGALPPRFEQLSKLATLDLSNNQLSALPDRIGRLAALRTLDIGNPLTTTHHAAGDPDGEPVPVPANRNSVAALPASIIDLPRLAQLFASGNQITALPDGMDQLNTLRQLDLRGNPLPAPPEILARPYLPHLIIQYYQDALNLPPEVRLNEARLSVVGPRGAGKTALVDRLRQGDSRVEAVSETIWLVRPKDEPVRVAVWDADAGLLETPHQRWYSRRTLYLLVTDATQDEADNRLWHWLELLESFAGGPPVPTPPNKQEFGRFPLSTADLQARFPQVRGVYAVSARDGAGCDALRDRLLEQIGGLAHVADPVPRDWYQLKLQLEADGRPALTVAEFNALCRSHGIDDTYTHRALMQFLDDIDVITLLFSAETQDVTHLLQRNWVMQAIQHLLGAPGAGRFTPDALAATLPTAAYPPHTHPLLLQALDQASIGFVDPADGALVVPQRLPVERAAEREQQASESDPLRLVYQFPILPHSILASCIVNLRAFIAPDQMWRHGAVLAWEGCRCVLLADSAESQLTVTVTGPPDEARTLLGLVRTHLDGLTHALPGLHVGQRIVLTADYRVSESVAHLLTLEQMRVRQFVPESSQHAYDVVAVLDRYISPQVRRHAAPPLIDAATTSPAPASAPQSDADDNHGAWDRESAEKQLIHLRRVRALVESHATLRVRNRLLLTGALWTIAALLILQLGFLGIGRWVLIAGSALFIYLLAARRLQTASPVQMVQRLRSRIRYDTYAEIDFDDAQYQQLEAEYGFHESLL